MPVPMNGPPAGDLPRMEKERAAANDPGGGSPPKGQGNNNNNMNAYKPSNASPTAQG
jgi:hypothetical protein